MLLLLLSRFSRVRLCATHQGSPPGSPVPGLLQARTLEWVAMSFSNAWKWKGKAKLFSRVRLLVTPWTAAYQAPLSTGFSRQEFWSGLPLPSLEFNSKCLLIKAWSTNSIHITWEFIWNFQSQTSPHIYLIYTQIFSYNFKDFSDPLKFVHRYWDIWLLYWD